MDNSTHPRRPPRARRRAAAGIAAGLALLTLAACSSSPAIDPPPPAAVEQQPAGGSLTASDVGTWLDGIVPSTLASTGIPGAAVAVVADGRVLTSRGYGVADTGTTGRPRRAVDPESTVFRFASVSKTVTATAVMQLVERGRLDLDTDVRRYLDFPLATPKGTATLRNLLTHTAGFEERARGLIAFGSGASLRSYVADDPPEQVFAPGGTPNYSNYGYSLAGYIVQRVSGMPFAAYVQQNVFDRAGMGSSTFAQPVPRALAGRLASGYPDDSQPATPEEFIAAAPAGALSSTVTDMSRFMLGQLNALPAEQRILRPATLELMQRPALGTRELGIRATGRRMTLGFFDQRTNGRIALGHEGDSTVFHSAMQFWPREGVGVVIALNGNGRTATDSYTLRAALMDGFADRYLGSSSGERTGDERVDPGLTRAEQRSDAQRMAGTYESVRSSYSTFISLLRLQGQTTVTPRQDGTVVVAGLPGQFSPGRYEQLRHGLWRQTGGESLISAGPSRGPVTTITTAGALTVTRVDPAHDAAVVLPIAVGSLAVLVLALLAWPIGWLLRRHDRVPAAARGRVARILTRVGLVSALAAVVGWGAVLVALIGYQDVSDAPLRVLQALQLVGAAAVVPATVRVVDGIRFREGAAVVCGRVSIVLALGALASIALVFRLIAPSVSY